MMIDNDTINDTKMINPRPIISIRTPSRFIIEHNSHLRSKTKYIALLQLVEITKPPIFMITNVIYVFVQCSSPGRSLESRRIGNGETKKKLREEQRRRKRKRNPGRKMVVAQLSQRRTGVGRKARTC